MSYISRLEMNSDNQLLLDEVLESCRTKAEWNNEDRQKLKTLREKLGSPTEVAHTLEIAVATLYAWEKQESTKSNEMRPPPAYRQLKKLSELVARKHLDTIKPLFYDALMRMRDADDMMQRAGLCDEFWVMRSGKPFAIGNDAKTFEVMTNFMKDSPTNYYFVYIEPKEGGDQNKRIFRAMDSYEALQKKLVGCSEKIRSRFHGVPIPQDQAKEIGLVDPWISYAMAIYSEDGREKYQKRVDVWMEFMFDVSKDPQVEQKQFIWLELPSDEAETWREQRMPLLKKARK